MIHWGITNECIGARQPREVAWRLPECVHQAFETILGARPRVVWSSMRAYRLYVSDAHRPNFWIAKSGVPPRNKAVAPPLRKECVE